MTDLSPREKALVEAARELDHLHGKTMSASSRYGQFEKALRAYDPPKPKVPQIPAWEEFRKKADPYRLMGNGTDDYYFFNDVPICERQYNAIRTLTSKEAE